MVSSRDGHGKNIYIYIYTQTTMWDELKELGEMFDCAMYPGLIRLIPILKVYVDISQKLQLN